MNGKPRKNNVTDAQILKAYEEYGSAYPAAKALGIASSTVYRTLLRHSIEATGLDAYRQRITRFQGQEEQIRQWYEDGETLEKIRRRLNGASDYAIKHAIRRAGGELRENPIPTIRPEEMDRMIALHNNGISQQRIALEVGRSQGFVSRSLRDAGFSFERRSGSNHSRWKGGRFLTGEGYVRVHVSDADPLASMRNNSGHVLEHRLVMARKLGRVLLRSESVHHINGIRDDNRPENLQLRQGRHGNGMVSVCLDCGSHNIGSAPIAEH